MRSGIVDIIASVVELNPSLLRAYLCREGESLDEVCWGKRFFFMSFPSIRWFHRVYISMEGLLDKVCWDIYFYNN